MDTLNHQNINHYNIVTVAPKNYPHSGTWLEISETLFYAFLKLGINVKQSNNQIDNRVINIILGGSLIKAEEMNLLPLNTIVYNFEQLSPDSPWLNGIYKELITKFQVWDYSKKNINFLQTLYPKYQPKHVPLGYVNEIERIKKSESEDIDVLFYGSVNDRRKKILVDLENQGLKVKHLFGVYGKERDEYISKSKVILNMHFYSTSIFEIARVFYLLSNKKAVVSEITPNTEVPNFLKDVLCFAPYESLVDKCVEIIKDIKMKENLENAGYQAFKENKQSDILKKLMQSENTIASNIKNSFQNAPRSLNIGSGKDFKHDCVNIDIQGYWSPDIVADLSDKNLLGKEFITERFGKLKIEKGIFDRIICNDVIEHIPDVVNAMTNCLNMLSVNGKFEISVPYDLSYGAWQDPTHVRAFNERSWLYYTDWHWYLGWTETRFKLVKLTYIASDIGQKMLQDGCDQDILQRTPRAIDSMSVVLEKIILSEEEKLRALQIASR